MKNKEFERSLETYSQYSYEISHIPNLSSYEQERLFKLYKEGHKEYRNQLIEANLKLVISVAKSYANFNVPLNDIIEDGNIGLIKAVDTYDVDKNIKFSTYAERIIRNEIYDRIIKNYHYLSASRNSIAKAIELVHIKKRLANILSREPSDEEIIKEANISANKYYEFKRIVDPAIYLDETVKYGIQETTVGAQIPDTKQSVEDIVIEKELKKQVNRSVKLANLTELEAHVFNLRLGFNGDVQLLGDIAKNLCVSRQRVSAINKNAISKIKKVENHFGLLKEFI